MSSHLKSNRAPDQPVIKDAPPHRVIQGLFFRRRGLQSPRIRFVFNGL